MTTSPLDLSRSPPRRFGSPVLLPASFGATERQGTTRRLVMCGIVLIGLGAVILFSDGLRFGSSRDAVRFNDLLVVPAEKRPGVPGWSGGVAIVAGVVLLSVGVLRRREDS